MQDDVRRAAGATSMMDIVVLAIGLGLLGLTIGYAYACERL
ncbi:hypothetical protein [Rhodoplanes azumiensis]|uniref:Pilus assembly protein n=1 Tax=Rhodoplanes azumiensis TaxID=1897628 RepID=A0ABW5AN62_9BRAD